MDELGFQHKEVDGSTGYIYIHKARKVVVKLPYVCGSKKTKVGNKPYRTIPTKIIEVGEYETQIYVQPLADVRPSASKRAWKILTRYFGTDDDGCRDDCHEPSDFHAGNVAMWKGRAYRIDW